MNYNTKILILSFLAVGLYPLKAQQSPDERMDSVALSEVVVHASRDNTKLRSIPNSVSIISSKQIESMGINSLTDITSTAANVFMPDYGSKLTSPIYIRGIGSRINAPSVGLYVDYVPYFEKAAFNFDFFDINRIEVLRGPQGTQYGRNTMGGIVNIVTKSPWNYQGTDLAMQMGTYGTYLLNIGHYAKTNDKFAYSLALNYRHNDGFFTNEFLNEKVDKLDSYGMRYRIIGQVTPCFSVENIFSMEHSQQGGYPYAVYNDSLKRPEKIAYNQFSSYERDLISNALVMKYNGKCFNVNSISSYQFLSDLQSIDQDFSIDSLFFVKQDQLQNMLSQEFTVSSKENRKYTWLFGAYGFMQQFDNGVDVNRFKDKNLSMKKYDHIIRGGALFHQSVIRDFPVRNMSLTAGIRLDTETDQLGYKHDVKIRSVLSKMADTIYNDLESMEILPKIALNYKFGNTNLYALLSRGYKTGGFNSTFERPEDLTFEPEYSWNYEAGAKSTFFSNKVFADVSVFYIDWKNQQIYQTTPSGRGSMLKNAGHSVSKGLELSISNSPVHGFECMAAYGYTHATFLSHILNANVNYNGNFIPYVPRHTLAVQAKKTIRMAGSAWLDKVVVSAMYKGNGEIYWNERNSHKQDYYGLLDARLSLIRKNFGIDFWGSNLMETQYEAFYFETSGQTYTDGRGRKFIQSGKPLQAGVRLYANF